MFFEKKINSGDNYIVTNVTKIFFYKKIFFHLSKNVYYTGYMN